MNATLLLSIATLALVVGPLLERLGRRLPALAFWIDGATVGGVITVAVLHLLPEAGAHLGFGALALFAVGLLLPTLAERLLEQTQKGLRLSVGVLIVVLFIAHEVIEGAALASKAHQERLGIATLLVVVGHRLPLGVLLWGQTKRRYGAVVSGIVLAIAGAITFVGPLLVPVQQEGLLTGVLSGLLSGGLVHLVIQHRPALNEERRKPAHPLLAHVWSTLGGISAVLFFIVLLSGSHGAEGHEHGHLDLAARLGDLLLEVSFPLLLGLAGAALVEAYLPLRALRWLARGGRARQAAGGVILGAPMPVCSCGVLPIYRALIQKGAPPTAALALLVAAPEIGIDSLLLSWPLLGPATTVARLACALLLALGVAWIVGRSIAWSRPAAEAPALGDQRRETHARALRRGLLDTWRHLAPWILVGLIAAALAEPWISTEWAKTLPGWAQIVVLSLAGMPAYICATAATPFAAVLLVKGFTPGAVIAFLLTGPATNMTTFGALASLHTRGVAVRFVLTALALAMLLGLGTDLLLAPGTAVAALHEHAEEHGPLQWISAILLGLLSVWVLLIDGPRGFLGRLTSEGSDAGGDHGHGHAPGTACGDAQGAPGHACPPRP